MRWMNFFNLPNPSGHTKALGFTQPLTEMSTRNRKIIFLWVECSRYVGLTTLPPSVSRLSRQCGILDISQPYRPPWPVTFTYSLYQMSSQNLAHTSSCMFCHVPYVVTGCRVLARTVSVPRQLFLYTGLCRHSCRLMLIVLAVVAGFASHTGWSYERKSCTST
jgi:hypothetical protein